MATISPNGVTRFWRGIEPPLLLDGAMTDPTGAPGYGTMIAGGNPGSGTMPSPSNDAPSSEPPSKMPSTPYHGAPVSPRPPAPLCLCAGEGETTGHRRIFIVG